MAIAHHIPETDLALFISGDLSMWAYVRINLHVTHCEACRERIEVYRSGRQRLKQAAGEMPEGADWDRLAAEMTANIRVGLAAGECVAPRRGKLDWKPSAGYLSRVHGWRAVAAWGGITAGAAALLSVAFLLNLPASDGDSIARFLHTLVQGGGRSTSARAISAREDRGPVVEASSNGVELRENGVVVSIPQAPTRPVAITVSAPGSASARYVDDDTGQMTISSVYVQ
jgi:hypothetical protein